MSPHTHDGEREGESEDARMRALFGQVDAPPMGDEAFVGAVMGRVREEKAARSVQRQVGAFGLAAMAGALLWPYKAAIGTGLTLTLARYVPDAATVGGGASALIIAAAASLAALVYAERG